MNNDQHTEQKRGRGIGTIIACFVIAIVIAGVFEHDDTTVRRAQARDALRDNADRITYRINKGHVIIVPTDGAMKIDMKDELRLATSLKTNGLRTVISVDDDFQDDVKIKIFMPAANACRVELAAGLLEVKRPPCIDNDLIVRSGKMEVTNVPKDHGLLSGDVSVGSVTITGTNGKQSKSAGVGELHAEVPGTNGGTTITARVNVGMLTVDAD